MSDQSRDVDSAPRPAPSLRGQSMVEFGLLLPIVTLLLVMAIDFGRVYFGWVALTNAARVGANYAANNADWTAADQLRFEDLIESDAEARNCTLQPIGAPEFSRGGIPVSDPALGDYATVELTCAFPLITPLAAQVLGSDTLTLVAASVFPVRDGCASCPPPPPAPVPEAPDQCREVPEMAGLSVAGARLAWQSAGFSLADFIPETGSETRTVELVTVNENDPNSGCPSWTPGTWAIFSSTATAILVPAAPTDPSCETVPNLKGLTIGDARQEWSDAGFTGDFEPPDQDALVVTEQVTDPDTSEAGVTCLPPTTNVTVTPGPAWPAAPAAPCQVPNFTGVKRDSAAQLWTDAGFAPGTITYDGNGNFTIQRQTLVGLSWVDCDSTVEVSD